MVTRHFGATQQVLAYLRAHPDVTIPYTEVSHETGVRLATLSNSIGYLIEKGVSVERPMRGMVIFHSTRQAKATPKPHTSDVYEHVGSSDGFIIVRGEDNEMYVLTPLRLYLKDNA